LFIASLNLLVRAYSGFFAGCLIKIPMASRFNEAFFLANAFAFVNQIFITAMFWNVSAYFKRFCWRFFEIPFAINDSGTLF